MRPLIAAVSMLLALLGSGHSAAADGPLTVGSKRFTESTILGEIVAQTAAAHTQAQHKPGLGNTAVVLEALKAGAIDVYPEYLGTVDAEILHNPQPTDLPTMRRQLAAMGLGVGVALGLSEHLCAGHDLGAGGPAGRAPHQLSAIGIYRPARSRRNQAS